MAPTKAKSKKASAAAAPAPAPAPVTTEQPNLYEVKGGRTVVSYSTSSISGQPLFNYKDSRRTLSFSGSQITTLDAGIATLVTVVIDFVPDLKDVQFTLVIPRVNLRNGATEAKLATFGITTTTKSSIGGPGLVNGQVQSYKVTELAGTAKSVLF
jgi:hypothetical protein